MHPDLVETLVQIAATIAMLLIVAGLFFASDRRRHVPLMLAAFAIDVLALLVVEIVLPLLKDSRDPVTSVLTDPQPLKVIHAIFATGAMVGYVLQTVSGRKLLRADRSVLSGHRKVARFFIVTRLLAYITMFMV